MLRRKVERDNMWNLQPRIESELNTRLILALSALRSSSDAAAQRLERLTWLVAFTVVIAAFTVPLFLRR